MNTPGPIDPRLRQRRIAVRRAEGRRRLHVLIGIGLVIALTVGGYGLSQSTLLDLDAVNVKGAFASEADEVRTAAALAIGTPLVELDLDSALTAVSAIPWVESASIARDWPGQVTIDLVRRTPAAAMADGSGGFVLIDKTGVAMAAAGEIGDLPLIRLVADGELGSVQAEALPALAVAQAMPGDVGPWVEHISLDYRGTETPYLTLDLVGRATAEFGAPNGVPHKFESLRTILGGIDLRCVQMIDVRVPDTTTVTSDPACSRGPDEDVS